MASSTKYVIDRPFGGSVPFQEILGPEDAASGTSNEAGERVWPLIPPSYELPDAKHEETIKECMFYRFKAE
jgi:hypothetical protein